jgi:hypothetical protein
MKDNEDIIKKILEHAKPDEMMMMEAIKKANQTIIMLSNQLQTAEARWSEMFIVLATIMNKYGREMVLEDEDMIPLSPHDYTVTIEPDEANHQRIIRLRHITDENIGEDDQSA